MFPGGSHGSSIEWEIGVPQTDLQSGSGPDGAGHTGTEAWCTGCDIPVAADGRFQAWLVAQPFVFDLAGFSGGNLELSWWHWQVNPGLPQIDLSRVQASSDGGDNIQTVWGPSTASTGDWQFITVDISEYLGGDLTFGFSWDTLTGLGFSDADGWYIDDVQLIWYP